MSVMPPTDTPADLYLLLGRIDGKVDGIAGTLAAMNTRTDRVEERVGSLEHQIAGARSEIDTIQAERGQMVPDFKHLLTRADDLEEWRTDVKATARATKTMITILWAVLGSVILSMGGWAVHAYVASLNPQIEHRETTKIESTITAPAPSAS